MWRIAISFSRPLAAGCADGGVESCRKSLAPSFPGTRRTSLRPYIPRMERFPFGQQSGFDHLLCYLHLNPSLRMAWRRDTKNVLRHAQSCDHRLNHNLSLCERICARTFRPPAQPPLLPRSAHRCTSHVPRRVPVFFRKSSHP